MNELALFAGAGGGVLGSILVGHQIVCAVELDPYCREVLLRRQEEGCLPPFPIWDDVRSFDGRPWRGVVDLVSAGFPCQPFSVVGERRGERDGRNLWPQTIRVLREVGPRFAFLENVPGLLSHDYFGEVLGDLGEAGFDASWEVVSAAEVGAPHLRKRLWIVAHANGAGVWEQSGGRHGAGRASTPQLGGDVQEGTAPDSDDSQFEGPRESESPRVPKASEGKPDRCRGPQWDWGEAPSPVCGVDDGVAYRVDRLRATGNGQVPQVAEEAWRRLKEE